MSKILITGMSAPQMSINANSRSLSFAGVIEKVLTDAGHKVAMIEPDITWTEENLDYYDAVLVGFSPITSLSANKAYGALHIMHVLRKSKKLCLFIDAPQPAQLMASLRSIALHPKNLTKEFYSNRTGYQLAQDPSMSSRMLEVINRLLNNEWPKTLYPSLPWKSQESVIGELQPKVEGSLHGINLDAYLVSPAPVYKDERIDKWAADTFSTKWVKTTLNTLKYPATPMKWNKGWTDSQVYAQISPALGSLISPHRDGTWWTYRYAQSLNAGTPIASEWKETQIIGSSWNVLAAHVEEMNEQERDKLSYAQKMDYIASIPSKEGARERLETLIGIYSSNRKGVHDAV
jgi:hypothetical protein